MEQNTPKKVIEKIKTEHITPDPKWKLNWKSYLFWVLLSIMVLLAAIFLSLALLSVVNYDVDILRRLRIGRVILFLILTAPVLWILLFISAIILGFLTFRKTRRGYRHGVLFVSSIILFTVSVLGVAAHIWRVNERLEENISQRAPGLHNFASPSPAILVMPNEGVLGGRIEEMKTGEIIVLDSFKNEQWNVHYSESTQMENEDPLEIGQDIVVVGEKVDNGFFEADIIKQLQLPFRGKRIRIQMQMPQGTPHPMMEFEPEE